MPIIQPPPISPPNYSVQDDGISLVIEFISERKKLQRAVRLIFLPLLLIYTIFLIGLLIYASLISFSFDRLILSLVYITLIWLFTALFPLAMLWISSLKEIVKFSGQSMIIKRYPVLGPMQTNQYLSKHIKNLKYVNSLHNLGNAKAAVGIGIQGPFTFQYGGKKFFFGMGIPQEEAEEVLTLITKKFPQYTNNKSTSESLN